MTEQQTTIKLLRLKQVRETVGMGTSWIYGEIKKGNFPAPMKIGRASLWRDDKIQDWIQTQTEKQEAA